MGINKFRRFGAMLLAVMVVFTLLGSFAASGASRSQLNALERQKEEISKKIEEAQAEMDILLDEHASVMEKKNYLDEQTTLAYQEIDLINEQIEIYDGLIAEKEVELVEAKAQEAFQKERFRTRMRAMEENGTLGYIAFVFQAKSFSELITRWDDISEILQSDKALEEKYIAARENTEMLKAEYEEIQAEQLVKREELKERKAELELQLEEAIAIIVALDEDIEAFRTVLDENEAMEAELQKKIDQMILEIERQETLAGGGSIQGTGTYIWPLPGYKPGSAYGWRMHPILGEMRFHSGEDVGAPSGTPILAADGGTVIMAGINGGYGNCVMVNHGGGRVTLYAHMSAFAVSYGQKVSQGQVLGYVGSTGLSTGPHLHYEVRVNGSTTDPKQYYKFG